MKWCDPTTDDPIVCMKWICKNCNYDRGSHRCILPHNCPKKDPNYLWSKKVFEFLHNDNCTIECQIKYKVEQ